MPRVEAARTEDLPGFEITQSFNQNIEIYGLRDNEAGVQGSHGWLRLTFGASKSYSFWNAFLEDSASRLL